MSKSRQGIRRDQITLRQAKVGRAGQKNGKRKKQNDYQQSSLFFRAVRDI